MKIKRYCNHCKAQLGRHKYKYCNNRCQKLHEYNLWISDWKDGKKTGYTGKTYAVCKAVRKYLFEKYNNTCAECPWNRVHPITKKCPLEVHHLDGDPSNCTESNLILLCPGCHSLTSNFRNLNKQSIRKR